MKKLLNRKEALGMIDAIFTSLHFNLISIKDLGIENSKERDYFLTEAWKIDQGRLKKDYEQTVNSLDAIGFKEYYKLIGKFATKYKIGCWKEYNEYEPILIEELNEELRKYDKTEDKLELINSFTVDELQSESFIFDSKVQVLYDILDDFNVGNKKEEGINTVLESFNSSDKASFIAKLQTDKNLLNALIDKVNGNEKNQLLTYLYKFLSSADGFGAEEYKLPPKAGFDAKYKKGKVIISTYYYIDRKISRYKYRYIEKNRELNPFTNVTFCYGNDQNEITVPAIVLVKSRGDVVLYDDFYKSNIDWKSLTEEKKRELYTEFVLHYLPKELGDAAVGNPITFLIMIIVGAVIAKASAVIAACASLIGTGFSAVNIIEGCKMITKVAEGYDSISDVNAAKVSAKDCARGIALLGVEIIPVLFGLIKRGIAKYNGKKIKVGETSRSLNETSFANQSQVDAVYSEKSQQSLNSETIISKINNDELIRKYKNRLIDESSNIKKKGGLSDKKVQEILNVPKGSRPNTSEYLSKEYINIHIQKFDNGYSYLLTKNQYKMYVYKKENLGIPSDGTLFVAPTGFIDELCDLAKNNYAVFESILGFEPGYYSNGNGLIRIDIKADIRFNVRIPTGNEAGVNNYWIPGGFTSGGMPEAITDLIPNTEEFVKISEIKGAK